MLVSLLRNILSTNGSPSKVNLRGLFGHLDLKFRPEIWSSIFYDRLKFHLSRVEFEAMTHEVMQGE